MTYMSRLRKSVDGSTLVFGASISLLIAILYSFLLSDPDTAAALGIAWFFSWLVGYRLGAGIVDLCLLVLSRGVRNTREVLNQIQDILGCAKVDEDQGKTKLKYILQFSLFRISVYSALLLPVMALVLWSYNQIGIVHFWQPGFVLSLLVISVTGIAVQFVDIWILRWRAVRLLKNLKNPDSVNPVQGGVKDLRVFVVDAIRKLQVVRDPKVSDHLPLFSR